MTTDLYDFTDLEESLSLSTHALSALHEFLAEQREAEDAFSALQVSGMNRKKKATNSGQSSRALSRSQSPPSAMSSGTTSGDDDDDDAASDSASDDREEPAAPQITMASFKEDWQLSQFWYDDETAKTMGDELVRRANGGMIVCVSAPTCFLYLKNLNLPNKLVLLEIDTRFAVFSEFKQYDYLRPLEVDGLEDGGELFGAAAAVVLDPPFLNEDCATKSCKTVAALCNKDTSVLVSTGWTVREFLERDLGARIANFRPRHKGGLANAFRCYVNYEADNDEFAYSTNPDDGCNHFLDQV